MDNINNQGQNYGGQTPLMGSRGDGASELSKNNRGNGLFSSLLGATSGNDGDPTASSRTGVPLHLTAFALVSRENDWQANERGLIYYRKVMALLFLQYTVVLVIVSPFCLLESVKQAVLPFAIMTTLSTVSFLGLAASIYLVLVKGHMKRFARISFFSITIFVAVGLGLKLARVSWSTYALVAVGQAVTNFAVILAVLQFDSRHLKWLRAGTSYVLCLGIALFWVLLMREAGSSWIISTTVPFGGWLYSASIIYSVRKSAQHRDPNDYLRATIFILGPNIPDRFMSMTHTADTRWANLRSSNILKRIKDQGRDEETKQAEERTGYGAMDSIAATGDAV